MYRILHHQSPSLLLLQSRLMSSLDFQAVGVVWAGQRRAQRQKRIDKKLKVGRINGFLIIYLLRAPCMAPTVEYDQDNLFGGYDNKAIY